MSKAVLESVKEVARLAVLAGVSAVVGWGITKLGGLDPSSLWVVIGLPLLRAVDKWIHENQDVSANGLVPF